MGDPPVPPLLRRPRHSGRAAQAALGLSPAPSCTRHPPAARGALRHGPPPGEEKQPQRSGAQRRCPGRRGGGRGGAGLRAAAWRSRGAAGPGSGGSAGAGHSQRQPWAGRHKGSITRLPERRRSPGNRPLPLYPGASPGWGRGGAGVSAGACPACPGARSRLRSRSYVGCGRRARSTVGPGGRPLRAAGRVPASAPRPRRRCPGAP